MSHRYYTLDVFTTTRFEGNPLAVFTDGDGLSDNAMQAIAREMNLSETVFVQKPTEDNALARLRIFTTREELKLAGHPVIGTWFLLAELGVVPAQEGGVHVLQQTGAGVLPVEIRFKDGRPQRVTMTQKEAQFKPLKVRPDALAKALLNLVDMRRDHGQGLIRVGKREQMVEVCASGRAPREVLGNEAGFDPVDQRLEPPQVPPVNLACAAERDANTVEGNGVVAPRGLE